MKEKKKTRKRISSLLTKGITVFLVLLLGNNTVFGTDNPLTVINNLSTFIFSIIRAIGMILLGWGIVQIGLALKSHDPSQRANRIFNIGRWSNNNICKRNTKLNYRRLNRASIITCP